MPYPKMKSPDVESAPTSPENAARLMRLATYASIAVAITLIVAKTIAWATTDSVVLLAPLIDSAVAGFASLINLFAVRPATPPARPSGPVRPHPGPQRGPRKPTPPPGITSSL